MMREQKNSFKKEVFSLFLFQEVTMQNRRFIEILDELKDETSDMLLYGNMMDSRIKEKYLRKLEKIRYELFENVNLENKY